MAARHAGALLRHLHRLAETHSGEGSTDGQLLERFAVSHEEGAFAALMQRHGRLVWGVCRHILHHDHDAEDAFQATFLVLAHRAASIRKTQSVGSWLHGVAYRIAVRAKQMAAKRQERERHAAQPAAAPASPDAAARELQALLDDEVARLPEKYRAPFVRCCLEGRSRAAVAAELGCNEGTLSSRIAQARRLLQERLSRRGVTLSAALTAGVLWGQTAAAVPPAALMPPTLRAALLITAGRATAEIITPSVAALVDAGMKAMAGLKLRLATALLLTASLVGGVGLAVGPRAEGERKPAARQPIAKSRPAKADADGDAFPPGVVARIGTTRFRHGGAIKCVAYAPDGKVLATGGQDEQVRLWDAATGQLIRVLDGHRGGVWTVSFSPDGKRLAASGEFNGNQVKVWDLASGKVSFELKAGDSARAAFSPDGRRLLSVDERGEVRLWDVGTGQELPVGLEQRPRGRPLGIFFRPDGKPLLACSESGAIRVFDVEEGKSVARMNINIKEVRCHQAAFSPDARLLALAGDRFGVIEQKGDRKIYGTIGIVQLWELATGKLLQQLEAEEKDGSIRGVAFSPDGKLLASGSEDRVVRLWNPATGKHLGKIQARSPGLAIWHPLAFSPDGKTIASGGAFTQGGQLWDVASGKALFEQPEGHAGVVRAVAISPGGKRIASAGQDQSLHVWDAEKKKLQWSPQLETWIDTLAFSPDGKLLAVDGGNRTIWLLDATTGKERGRFGPLLASVQNLVFSPDGKTLAAADRVGPDEGNKPRPNRIQLWDVASRKELWQATTEGGTFCRLAFTPDGQTLFSANGDKTIRVWQAATGKELRQFAITGMRYWFHEAAFSPDGKLAATNGFASGVAVWDLATGKQLYRFQIPDGFGYRLAFSPDSRFLAAGADGVWSPAGRVDATLRLWEMASGGEVLRYDLAPGVGGAVGALAFLPTGHGLVAGMRDTTLQFWDLVPPRTAPPSSPRELEALWADLAGGDAGRAYRAIHALKGSAARTVPFVKDHLRPAAAADAKRVEKLIADLDSEQFPVRDAAAKELAALGEPIEPLLKRVLEGQPPLEMRRRVEALLADLHRIPSGAVLRSLRAVQVLEYIGTPEAKDVLRNLAGGVPARQTRAAKEALDRLSLPAASQ